MTNDKGQEGAYKIYAEDDGFRTQVAILRQHVEETLRQCERFAWLAEEIRDKVSKCSVEEWGEMLYAADSRVSSRERAMIALALSGSAEAGPILAQWNPEGFPKRLRLLWQVARVEWEHRFQAKLAKAYIEGEPSVAGDEGEEELTIVAVDGIEIVDPLSTTAGKELDGKSVMDASIDSPW